MRLMQAFYWDCPAAENKAGQWWQHLATQLPQLAQIGVTAVWLPPSAKSSHIDSMGYAPYDYYDHGEFDQKGGVKTWFGSVAELRALTEAAHDNGMQVIADAVLNHCDIGDHKELNPLTNKEKFSKYIPASGKFTRDWTNFHPCEYSSADAGAFYGDLEGYDLPDLCHDNPYTYLEVMEYIRYLKDRQHGLGYDAFRYDAVKYFDAWIVQSIQEWQKCFGVAEYWDGNKDAIKGYLDYIRWSCSAFDFPLFYALREMCNNHDYDLRSLWGSGLIHDIPFHAVSFCDNHDTDRSQPIVADKLLAYAVILTHEGVPCIFWKDYYNYGLGLPGTANGIARLCEVHRDYAGGPTSLLHSDQRLYIAQRSGHGTQRGLVVVINTDPDNWRGTWVQCQWPNTTLKCIAWWGHDMQQPYSQHSDGGGWTQLYAAPRGYAIYVPA
jgi:alpha-amylase